MTHSETINTLLEEFEKLPGIGRLSAERLVYHVLKTPTDEVLKLARALEDVKTRLRLCSECFNVTEADPCAICADPGRDRSRLCVVERPMDLLAVEKSGAYRGLYHVLMGRLAPLSGQDAKELTVERLLARLRTLSVEEVILATNPDTEGEGTALYLRRKLAAFPALRCSRLATGLPSGSHIEFASRTSLADALHGRRPLDTSGEPAA